MYPFLNILQSWTKRLRKFIHVRVLHAFSANIFQNNQPPLPLPPKTVLYFYRATGPYFTLTSANASLFNTHLHATNKWIVLERQFDVWQHGHTSHWPLQMHFYFILMYIVVNHSAGFCLLNGRNEKTLLLISEELRKKNCPSRKRNKKKKRKTRPYQDSNPVLPKKEKRMGRFPRDIRY